MRKSIEHIIGYPVTTLNLDSCVALIHSWLNVRNGCRYCCCANPHSLVTANQDTLFKKALLTSDLLVPDGFGIVLASRFQGGEIKDRITGSDMFQTVNQMADDLGGRKLFFLGSTKQTLLEIKKKLQIDYPNIKEIGLFSPPFKQNFNEADNQSMIAAINAFKPDILWIGMTAPKQEKWIYQNRSRIDVPFVGAIGAVFDFYTVKVKRSHPVFQKLGLEWLPRLLQEPRRLWKRNIISSPLFLLSLLQHKDVRRTV